MNKYIFLFSISLLTLTGCSAAKEELGLTRHSPDEFAIVKRAPLEVPTGKYTLPEPRPGMHRPQEQTAQEQARETVLGTTSQKTGKASGVENTLLAKTGAQNADPAIRMKVNNESNALQNQNKPVIDKLLELGGKESEIKASVVDAPAEVERLKKNREEGKSALDGQTPTIDN